LNTLLSIFVGLLLAIGTALMLEMRDRRIRAPQDVLASVGLPVIGVLPKPNAKRLTSGGRLSLMQQKVLGMSAPRT
jgi:capsular polysaccharide biosynthesis protein